MKVIDFITTFNEKNISDTKLAPNAVSDYIKKELDIITYIPFEQKKQIVEMIVDSNTINDNGIIKIDNMSQYVGFVIAMLTAHTNLDFGENPIADYDLLAESGLLTKIVENFTDSYQEFSTLVGICARDKMEDNNMNVIFNRFLEKIINRLDGILDDVKSMDLNDLNMEKIGKIFNK